MSEQTFKAGDKVFNAAGDARTVATDRRDRGGYLWLSNRYDSKSRERAYGTWIAGDETSPLYRLCKHVQAVAREPLRQERKALEAREKRIQSFVRLAVCATNGEPVDLETVTTALLGIEYGVEYQARRTILRERLGLPLTERYYGVRPATQGKILDAMLVYGGGEGEVVLVPVPPELLAADAFVAASERITGGPPGLAEDARG